MYNYIKLQGNNHTGQLVNFPLKGQRSSLSAVKASSFKNTDDAMDVLISINNSLDVMQGKESKLT